MAPPLNHTKVIPDNWVKHHRPVANGQMLDAVNIWSGPINKTFNEVTGNYDVTYGSKFNDEPIIGRLQQLAAAGATPAGGQQIEHHEYRLNLPAEIDYVHLDCWVEVIDCEEDSTLQGKYLKVIDLLRGTLIWQRDVIVTDKLG